MNTPKETLQQAIDQYVQEHLPEIHAAVLVELVRKGDLETVKYMLRECPVRVDYESHEVTPLAQATIEDNLEMVKLLIKFSELSGLDEAAKVAFFQGNADIVRELVKAGADQKTFMTCRSYYRDTTLLIEAAGKGDHEMVKSLLEFGAEVNYRGHAENSSGPPFSESYSALDEAVEGGHVEVVKLLLESGADLENLSGLLDVTVATGRQDIMMLLLERRTPAGEEMSEDDKAVMSAAMITACKHGRKDIAKTLLEFGADVNAKDSREYCALTYAALLGRDDIVDELTRNGADRSETGRLLNSQQEREQLVSDLQEVCFSSLNLYGDAPYRDMPICHGCKYCSATTSKEVSVSETEDSTVVELPIADDAGPGPSQNCPSAFGNQPNPFLPSCLLCPVEEACANATSAEAETPS
jgi:ankyrin repeat protein